MKLSGVRINPRYKSTYHKESEDTVQRRYVPFRTKYVLLWTKLDVVLKELAKVRKVFTSVRRV